MEFERSLFRVYEKILSGLNSGSATATRSKRYLKWVMLLNLGVALASFSLVLLLHASFVGDGTCLASSLHGLGLEPRILDVTANRNLTDGNPNILFSDSVIRIWAFPEEEPKLDIEALIESAPLDSDTMVQIPVIAQDTDDAAQRRRDKPDYEFSADPAFLLMDESLRSLHNVREWNVTLSKTCLGVWGRYSLLQYLVSSYLDEVIVNQFIHGLKDSEGVLRSQSTHETWNWSHERQAKRESSTIARIAMNLAALWRVCVLFLLVSSMTALMVRTLVSSGVAIMFPLFSMVRSLGFMRADVFRLLTLSYPWIGGDVEVLEATGQSMGPLVRAHMMNVFLTYAAYEACQFAWRRWLIGFKPQPAGVEVFIFAFVMICEYYMLIFARAPMTLRYLPRLLAMNFVLFVLYSFSVPYGFVSTLGITLWSASLFWMLYFILECELKALRRGVVSVETPRAFYTLLASPQWPMSLPPHWSTYHELNRAHRSIYDMDVSERDAEEGRGANSSRGANRGATAGTPSSSSTSTGTQPTPPTTSGALAHRRTRRGTENTSNAPLVINPPTTLSDGGASTRNVEDQV